MIADKVSIFIRFVAVGVEEFNREATKDNSSHPGPNKDESIDISLLVGEVSIAYPHGHHKSHAGHEAEAKSIQGCES